MKKLKTLKIFLIASAAVFVLLAGSFFAYVSDYYSAEDTAITVMQGNNNIKTRGNLTILPPSVSSDTALIFYPGGKVEHIAYLPILEKISQECAISCILVKMPFNLAFFDSNAADKIIAEFPDIKNWYISGHSLGGAMASSYVSKNQDKVKGLILLGAYIYGDYPIENALTVYGSFDTRVADKINYTENIVVIEGGNHAQFGNYGKQKGDADATISNEEQQETVVAAIKAFISENE